MAQAEFCNFLQQVGIREETAEKLWNGNVRSPQELASTKSERLNKIVDDAVLLNTIHPVLQKYAFPITMAPNPYRTALALMQKHCGEPMETETTQINGNTVQSDAGPIPQHEIPPDQPRRNTPRNVPPTNANNPTMPRVTITNSTTKTFLSKPQDQKETINHGPSKIISITGGNFVQSSFGDKPMVINNTNTTVQATSYIDANEERLRRRNEKVQPSFIRLKDCTFSTAHFQIVDEPDYWPSGETSVRKVEPQVVEQLRRDNGIYPVTRNRALIINVTKFKTAENERKGADVDAEELRKVLEQLGFEVILCLNKPIREIQQSLREFQNPVFNVNTSLSMVFIGSHGDRKDGEDFFIGQDNVPMPVSQVIDGFKGTNCPALIGKPKVFFYQFCRLVTDKKSRQKPPSFGQVNSDAVIDSPEPNVIHHPIHDEADMLQAFATAAGTKAYRDTLEGSWFVTALCKVLKEHAHDDDLLSMMTRVNCEVKAQINQEKGETAVQLSEVKSTLTKKIRFYPQ